MIKCNVCGKLIDENKAVGVCPFCGAEYNGDCENMDPRWLSKGTVLCKRYIVQTVIGAGGFGITYKVWDEKNKVYKAIKEYFQHGVVNRVPGESEVIISAPKRKSEFDYGKQRLIQEAEIVAKFQSSSIVRVDDYFEENNTSYMVMEYIDGVTLEDYLLKRKKVLTTEEATTIGIKICDALIEIHNAGVVHRDIAPDNIFIDKSGNVKIIDFGSARLAKEDVEDKLIVLKPGFAPPEQYEKIDLKNDRQKAWTDIYALGATLYLGLTGKVPPEASDRKIDLEKGKDSLIKPNKINNAIPENLVNILMTAMAVNIHERFQNADEMKKALLGERKVIPIEELRKRKKRHRNIGIVAGITVALCMIIVAAGWYKIRKNRFQLPKTDIEIWYLDEEDGTDDNRLKNIIDAELKNSDKYFKVNITIKVFKDKEEYESKLNEAASKGKLPDLFECVDCDAEYMNKASDVSYIYDIMNENDYVLIDKWKKELEKKKVVPLSFDIPIIYVNKDKIEEGAQVDSLMEVRSVEDIKKMIRNQNIKEGEFREEDEAFFSYHKMAVNDLMDNIYRENLSNDYNNFKEENSEDSFEGDVNNYLKTDDNVVVYLGGISEYSMISNSREINTEEVMFDNDEIYTCFGEQWAIGKVDADEKKVACEIISFMLSNNFQERYILSGTRSDIPIEKYAFENYKDYYSKFRNEALNDLDKYRFVIE